MFIIVSNKQSFIFVKDNLFFFLLFRHFPIWLVSLFGYNFYCCSNITILTEDWMDKSIQVGTDE